MHCIVLVHCIVCDSDDRPSNFEVYKFALAIRFYYLLNVALSKDLKYDNDLFDPDSTTYIITQMKLFKVRQ